MVTETPKSASCSFPSSGCHTEAPASPLSAGPGRVSFCLCALSRKRNCFLTTVLFSGKIYCLGCRHRQTSGCRKRRLSLREDVSPGAHVITYSLHDHETEDEFFPVSIHVCLCTCKIHVCACAHAHVCACVYTCPCLCVCMLACACVYMWMCVYMSVCMHI